MSDFHSIKNVLILLILYTTLSHTILYCINHQNVLECSASFAQYHSHFQKRSPHEYPHKKDICSDTFNVHAALCKSYDCREMIKLR